MEIELRAVYLIVDMFTCFLSIPQLSSQSSATTKAGRYYSNALDARVEQIAQP